MKERTGSGQNVEVYIASGSTHVKLAEDTAAYMNLEVGEMERRQFANTEQYVRYNSSVRGRHVFIIQSLAATMHYSVNDSLMELVLMVDAAKRASAAEITVVMPYLAYSRQDRKARGREPISVAAVIHMLQSSGADRLVSIDMHSAQTQATFNGPFDHLTAESLIRDALKARVAGKHDVFVVVSPDGGRAKDSEEYASELGLDIIHMPKKRDRNDSSKIVRPEAMPGVAGRTCLLVDDMIDTAGTLVSAAETLKKSGASHVIACATHALFSSPALERLTDAAIDELIVTDTVPLELAKKTLKNKLTILPIAPLLGEALVAIADSGSVSKIFGDRNHK